MRGALPALEARRVEVAIAEGVFELLPRRELIDGTASLCRLSQGLATVAAAAAAFLAGLRSTCVQIAGATAARSTASGRARSAFEAAALVPSNLYIVHRTAICLGA